MRFTTVILRNLLRRRVRTGLTVLGLAIGLAAVVALLGVSWGFERSFLKLYESKAIDLVIMKAGVSDRLNSTLPEGVVANVRAVPGVLAAAPTLTDVVSFEDANLVSVLCNGWEPESLLFRGIRPLQGRSLSASDADKKVALLGRVLALNLGKNVGDELSVAGEPFQVIGLFESSSLFENGGMIVPMKVLQRMLGREGSITGLVVKAESSDRAAVDGLRQRIEEQVRGVAAVPARDYIQGDIQVRLVKVMSWATSLIALLLGSLGVLNTMMMAVFERTREMGLLRALGWRRRRVLALILGEALSLGLAGSVFGALLGLAGFRALQLSPTASVFIEREMPPGVIGLAIGLGVGLSVVGGFYPALRAAELDPTEALRHE
jgi:putative ABC transport system permease protein